MKINFNVSKFLNNKYETNNYSSVERINCSMELHSVLMSIYNTNITHDVDTALLIKLKNIVDTNIDITEDILVLAKQCFPNRDISTRYKLKKELSNMLTSMESLESIGGSIDKAWDTFNAWLEPYIKEVAGKFNTMRNMVGKGEKLETTMTPAQQKASAEFMKSKQSFKPGNIKADDLITWIKQTIKVVRVFHRHKGEQVLQNSYLDEINDELKPLNLKAEPGKSFKIPSAKYLYKNNSSLASLGYGSTLKDFIKIMGSYKYEILDIMEIAENNKPIFAKFKAKISNKESKQSTGAQSKGDTRSVADLKKEFLLLLDITYKLSERSIIFANFMMDVFEKHEAIIKTKEDKIIKHSNTMRKKEADKIYKN